jgi:hypothetical protein
MSNHMLLAVIAAIAAASGSKGDFVINAGHTGSGSDQAWGYDSGSFGSLVSFGLTFGTTVDAFYAENSPTVQTVLKVSSSSNPGSSAFTTLSVSGTGVSGSLTSASASYGYASGVATWTWSTDSLLSGMTAGDQYTVSLT